MPADIRLTEVVTLLGEAKNKLADFIESKEGKEWLNKHGGYFQESADKEPVRTDLPLPKGFPQ